MVFALRKDSSVAVLGGGVSGLTFAATMKEQGFGHVVVFERADKVGGKSLTVDVDGRPHDLGATMGVPVDYRRVLDFSRRAGVRNVPFPEERHFSVANGREMALNRWHELPSVLAQAAKYLLLHGTRWRGADGTGLHRAPAELYRPWAELVDRHGLSAVNRRTLAYRTGYGYGFDDEVPAVLHANLFRPQTFFGLAVSRSFMWEGGTQPIWEALAKTLDVRTGTSVERIARDGHGVVIETRTRDGRRSTQRFDALVIAHNPRDALGVLDARPDETEWFSQVRTYPYATFACEVRGLAPAGSSVGYIDENMDRARAGHPMAWIKRYADQDVYVFHLFAPSELSDADIAARIAGDVERLGGRFVDVRASRRWQFFPHFTSEFMQQGGLERIERWQGRRRVYLIGEVLSYGTMARVAEYATAFAHRLARECEKRPVDLPAGARLESPLRAEQPLESPLRAEQPLESPLRAEQPLESPLRAEQPLESPLRAEQPLEPTRVVA